MNVDLGSGPITIFRSAVKLTPEEPRSSPSESPDDQEYFHSREQEERVAAKAATSELARRTHQELARLYGTLARSFDLTEAK